MKGFSLRNFSEDILNPNVDRLFMRTLGHILLPHVYISAPFVDVNPERNVNYAIDLADELYTTGVCLPVIPQLQYFWNKLHSHDDTFWDEMNYQILKRCDALLAFDEPDFPQDMELVEEAERIGIPVFYSTDELTDWKESE
jgi:hypothetical protein